MVIALLAGALMLGSGTAAAAQQDYLEADPVPLGQAVQLDASQATVTVRGVTTTETPAETFGGLAGADLEPGRAGLAVEVEIANGGETPFEPDDALDFRLVDAGGREHGTPNSISHCGDPETTWVWWGNIRPGRSATMTVCFVVPADQLAGAHLEIRWDEGGLFVPFALEPEPGATPAASPEASPMSL
jgi:hypothetical protein